MPVLTSDFDSDSGPVSIAENLVREAFAFGRFIRFSGGSGLSRYAERIAFTFQLLRVLEGVGDLRFAGTARLPYVWNTVYWPHAPGTALAGYTDVEPAPLPSAVLHTLLAGWAAAEQKKYPATRP